MSEVKHITSDEAREFFREHSVQDYTILDVRQPWEYEEFHLPGARLLPLPELADRQAEIPRDKPVFVYCRSGNRSMSGAGLLVGLGHPEVANMVGGVSDWNGEVAEGGLEQGLAFFRGDEGPLALLEIAYSMEANLGAFYRKLAGMTDGDIAETFSQLARFEDAHMTLISKLREKSGAQCGRCVESEALEGGFSIEEFLAAYGDRLDSPEEILETAMALEAQAVDLYMRYSRMAEKAEAVELSRKLADEEKKHLATLGRLMDRCRS